MIIDFHEQTTLTVCVGDSLGLRDGAVEGASVDGLTVGAIDGGFVDATGEEVGDMEGFEIIVHNSQSGERVGSDDT